MTVVVLGPVSMVHVIYGYRLCMNTPLCIWSYTDCCLTHNRPVINYTVKYI